MSSKSGDCRERRGPRCDDGWTPGGLSVNLVMGDETNFNVGWYFRRWSLRRKQCVVASH